MSSSVLTKSSSSLNKAFLPHVGIKFYWKWEEHVSMRFLASPEVILFGLAKILSKNVLVMTFFLKMRIENLPCIWPVWIFYGVGAYLNKPAHLLKHSQPFNIFGLELPLSNVAFVYVNIFSFLDLCLGITL